MPLYETEEDEVMLLQERVAEAQRMVKMEVKDIEDNKKSGKRKKRGDDDDEDDTEQSSGVRKRVKGGGGGRGGGGKFRGKGKRGR